MREIQKIKTDEICIVKIHERSILTPSYLNCIFVEKGIR